MLRAHGSLFLDQIDEFLLSKVKKIPLAPSPYRYNIEEKNSYPIVHLDWFNGFETITRNYNNLTDRHS